jgi:Mg-chelatase subunit ChlD
MESKGFALKIIGVEALTIAMLGTLAFFYTRSLNEASGKSSANPLPQPATSTFAVDYLKNSKTVRDLASAIRLRPDVDLIVFVIDTSASMQDDRKELRDSINKISDRYKGRAFTVVNFADTAEVAGEPTRNLVEVQKYIDSGLDLGSQENSFAALTASATKAREKFKTPAIILMTDAAPHDGLGSRSQVTIDEAASALNTANAELHVWAAYDLSEDQSGGAAANSPLYPELVRKVRAGGNVYLIKRDIDPNLLPQLTR